MGDIGHMADLAQRLDQIIGGIVVVFDDQQAHGSPFGLDIVYRSCRSTLPINVSGQSHQVHRYQLSSQSKEREEKNEGMTVARHPLARLLPQRGRRMPVQEYWRWGRVRDPPPRGAAPAGATDAGETSLS